MSRAAIRTGKSRQVAPPATRENVETQRQVLLDLPARRWHLPAAPQISAEPKSFTLAPPRTLLLVDSCALRIEAARLGDPNCRTDRNLMSLVLTRRTQEDQMPQTLDEYPELLTVDEAAEYLRISRALGYQLARRYRITGGEAGLPVVQVGRCLRVPRRALARFITDGGDAPARIRLRRYSAAASADRTMALASAAARSTSSNLDA